MGESTLNAAVKDFAEIVVKEKSGEYLRPPTDEEMERILRISEIDGFPGCFGSLDCTHRIWKNCPVAEQGQHKRAGKKPTLVEETIVDADLYCHYYYFGAPGSCNDINVLDRSPTLVGMLSGRNPLRAPKPYCVRKGGIRRDWVYFLTDGTYPKYSIFISPFDDVFEYYRTVFNKEQERKRKEVERFYAVIALKYQYLQHPLRHHKLSDIVNIAKCCVILHNMSVKNRIKVRQAQGLEDHIWWEDEESDEGEAARNPGTDRSLFGTPQLRPNATIGEEIAERVASLSEAVKDSKASADLTNITAITKKIKPVPRWNWNIVTDFPVKSL